MNMHRARRWIALAFLTGLLPWAAPAAELTWLTDLPRAQEQARKENKMVLMNFTGSDWCSWCFKLKRDIFSTPEFAEYAGKNLVLVEVDFPRRKKLSPEQKKANQALQAKYKAGGFPTLVALSSAGKEVWKQVGYLPGGPQALISKLDEAKKK